MSRARTCPIKIGEGRGRKSARLGEDQDLIAEDHERRDGLDLELGREHLLVLRIDLAEDDVGILVARRLEGGREHLARAAPVGPEVEDHDVVVVDRRFDVVGRDSRSGHEDLEVC